MKEYILPKSKKRPASSATIVDADMSYIRRVSLPADASFIKDFEVGQSVKIMLEGTITEVSLRESDGRKRANFDMDVNVIKLHDEKMSKKKKEEKSFADLADD